MTDNSEPVWSLRSATLAGRMLPRLDAVTLDIPAGVTAVMGCSGAGKSSLLGLLTEFEKPVAGDIEFSHPDPTASLPLFWSPQDHGLWPQLTVAEHIDYVAPAKQQIDRTTLQWLELFDLDELLDALPESLSQGERSRLAIVRALASEASVLVLDEPLVHVDPMLAHRCWQILEEHICTCCLAVVFSTHDPDAVLKFAQNIVCLSDGVLQFSGTVETLYYDSPTKELAWLLGPCNWLDDRDVWKNLDVSLKARGTGCVRPSQLNVRPDSNGPFAVEEIIKAVSVTELRLRCAESKSAIDIFVSNLSADIAVGDRIRLTVHQVSAGL